MNRGTVLQSSPVQQMLSGCPNSWWSMMASSRPSPPHPPPLPPRQPPFLAASAQPHCFHHQYAPSSSSLSQWHDNQDFPDSLSQLLMGGLDEKTTLSYMQQVKKLENWEEQLLHGHCQHHNTSIVSSLLDSSVKQEHSVNHGSAYGVSKVECLGVKPNTWLNPMIPVSSSPGSSLSNNSHKFSTTISNKADGRHPPPDHSSECDSTATGGPSKKAKIQASPNQTTFKARKEKIGDRITALHQLVSPFGKTDTASVLLEAIGYIRFLHGQIEALSLPYLRSGSTLLMRNHPHVVQQRKRNCLFPKEPDQILNDSLKIKGPALDEDSHEKLEKDFKSRGLCLVPVLCTIHVESNNGADYWAPDLNGS